MQVVAEMWLVLQLTHSGVAVGTAAALQFAPMLVGGAWGGLIADRLPKRQLLIATQTAMAIPALLLFALTATGAIELWSLYLLIFARGAVNAVDNPARQAFLVELVGHDRLVNAVSLGSALINGARTIGPALAGVVIATVGVTPCFALNALSFAAMIVALRGMDAGALHSAPVAAREPGQVRSGLRYVRATPELWIPLALMAIVGTFTSTSRCCCRCSRASASAAARAPTRRSRRRWGWARSGARSRTARTAACGRRCWRARRAPSAL